MNAQPVPIASRNCEVAVDELETTVTLPIDELSFRRAAQVDVCILLTGRQDATAALAWEIHQASGWRHGPFVSVDCNGPSPVVERRLFDALEVEDGRPDMEVWPRMMQPGTVLLRNVGDLDPGLQRRLAAHLEMLRTGHRRARKRVIATSAQPLADRIDEGRFDETLFYRLNVIHIMVDGDE